MKNSVLKIALSALALLGISSQVKAYVTDGILKPADKSLLKTTAGCRPATQSIDLDINNVRSRVMTGGEMWYNLGTRQAAYEVPKGSRRNSLYAGSCWIGGIDGNKQLKVAAQLFRQDGNDYWAGPIDRSTQNITEASCSEWDKFWKVDASAIFEFREYFRDGGSGDPRLNDAKFDVIKQWPATGNIYAVGANGNALQELLAPADQYGYAPFIDVNRDNVYNWRDGDYPRGFGDTSANPDQFIWWVFNDMGNAKLQTKTLGIGIEVQTMAFAYSSSDFLNDATFYNYRLINRGYTVLDSCFIATWTDADLGNPYDDYIGCDTARGLGILYNAEPVDRENGENSYGNRLPMVGVDFFIGPQKKYFDPVSGTTKDSLMKMTTFSYFEGTRTGALRDPDNGPSFYNYMTGRTYAGIPFSNDQSRGKGSVGYGEGPIAPFVFYGDPGINGEWSQCACENPAADRRFIHSSGPFKLEVGVMNDITIGVVWVDNAGGCGSGASFKKIKAADDIAQGLFDTRFVRLVAPDAPILTIREMDKRLICYLSNPPESNNFNERYGDPRFAADSGKYRSVAIKAKGKSLDTLYRFEGYRVFQLRSPSVTSIYDENGNLTEDAVEVFQTDRKNGITQIANYTKNLEVKNPVDQFNTSIKVNGKDSGIVHSFVLTRDAFASAGSDQSLVNYKTYYYLAVAYAYNNFADFDPSNEVGTQDKPYIESDKRPGNKANKFVTAMPNSMNQSGDTFSNAGSYGQGVIITRLEGSGNGGNDLQLTDESEAEILRNNSINNPVYLAGRGPINVKVVDPVRIINANWRVVITGRTNAADTALGLIDTASRWRIEQLDDNGNVVETVFSESDIQTPNEQILARYGLSVEITQAQLPGVEPANGNGYITSEAIFEDKSKPWLNGVHDASGEVFSNWLRSGGFKQREPTPTPCGPFDDYDSDPEGVYSRMFANNSNITSTWGPYDLADTIGALGCGFGPAMELSIPSSLYVAPPTPGSTLPTILPQELPNVDLVFTSDKTKWTRCAVIESGNDPTLTEGGATRMRMRKHRSWNMQIDEATGKPIYSANPADTGYSWFPGYAIDQNSGERLNIVFSEDSYLKQFNGADMIWNPSADLYSMFGEVIFGGKHFTYILNTKYDSCRTFGNVISSSGIIARRRAWRQARWVGIPTLNTNYQLLSLKDGLIPTTTRLRFRVNTPYRKFKQYAGQTIINDRNPVYTFSTKGMAPSDWTQKTDADPLMDKIVAVPNPYKAQAFGNASYENGRLETKIKIINLPNEATIHIYSLDGTMVRKLTKSNNEPFLVWDLLNNAGLPIASGMYLIHVKAYGKDKVIRWFGAMRPLDVTNY